jgi:hypothetical protein
MELKLNENKELIKCKEDFAVLFEKYKNATHIHTEREELHAKEIIKLKDKLDKKRLKIKEQEKEKKKFQEDVQILEQLAILVEKKELEVTEKYDNLMSEFEKNNSKNETLIPIGDYKNMVLKTEKLQNIIENEYVLKKDYEEIKKILDDTIIDKKIIEESATVLEDVKFISLKERTEAEARASSLKIRIDITDREIRDSISREEIINKTFNDLQIEYNFLLEEHDDSKVQIQQLQIAKSTMQTQIGNLKMSLRRSNDLRSDDELVIQTLNKELYDLKLLVSSQEIFEKEIIEKSEIYKNNCEIQKVEYVKKIHQFEGRQKEWELLKIELKDDIEKLKKKSRELSEDKSSHYQNIIDSLNSDISICINRLVDYEPIYDEKKGVEKDSSQSIQYYDEDADTIQYQDILQRYRLKDNRIKENLQNIIKSRNINRDNIIGIGNESFQKKTISSPSTLFQDRKMYNNHSNSNSISTLSGSGKFSHEFQTDNSSIFSISNNLLSSRGIMMPTPTHLHVDKESPEIYDSKNRNSSNKSINFTVGNEIEETKLENELQGEDSSSCLVNKKLSSMSLETSNDAFSSQEFLTKKFSSCQIENVLSPLSLKSNKHDNSHICPQTSTQSPFVPHTGSGNYLIHLEEKIKNYKTEFPFESPILQSNNQ